MVDGPPLIAPVRIQIVWLAVTSVMVLGLAAYGTWACSDSSHGAGGGQGPSPLAKPPAGVHPLEIQVIGQQWLWTFRYPSYGGVETATLELPVNRWVVFHVTSLDVDHSFWAYELGVKADAIPGSDNVAYVEAKQTGQIPGALRRAVRPLARAHELLRQGRQPEPTSPPGSRPGRPSTRPITKTLPPYSHVYYPDPIRRAG